ncbi:MAG: Fe-S metabolism protein SufE [Crocinitomicaceae bacterium TMED16]|nr:MAG: Fe-S metabolism protein SufE [Crocinitomicaceae bacterium TMED16]|tara:strand:+ start:462 stop:878 length:417 start_codon:yes stop_codon:yes gene_type:complete
MSASFKEKQDAIISDFEVFDDWMDKYEMIIDLGKEIQGISLEKRKDEQLIDGCQSRVWLKSDIDNTRMVFAADSDAIITKGIIALLINVYNGEKPETIVKEDLYFIDQIGLQEHLSPTRANGLLEMVKRMKIEALKHV